MYHSCNAQSVTALDKFDFLYLYFNFVKTISFFTTVTMGINFNLVKLVAQVICDKTLCTVLVDVRLCSVRAISLDGATVPQSFSTSKEMGGYSVTVDEF